MQYLLDNKLTYVFVGCLIALLSYFANGYETDKNRRINHNSDVAERALESSIVSAQTLINISHQLREVTDLQREQTRMYYQMDKNISTVCNNQKQYWEVHGCSGE